VHVQGSSLDLRQYTVNTRVGGTAAAMSEWVSSSALLCKVAAGTKDANGVVVVTAGSVAASSRRLFSYDAPSISGVEKADSPGSASVKVWMRGENFGASDVTAQARFGGGAPASSTHRFSFKNVLGATCGATLTGVPRS